MTPAPPDGRRTFAVLLLALAGWTISIKYLAPLLVARAEGVPPGTYVLPDAWPLAHVALAWSLLRPGAATWLFAMVVAVAEIVVVGIKFAVFLAHPVWTPWKANWFVNKCAVIALFAALLVWLLRSREGAALRERR